MICGRCRLGGGFSLVSIRAGTESNSFEDEDRRVRGGEGAGLTTDVRVQRYFHREAVVEQDEERARRRGMLVVSEAPSRGWRGAVVRGPRRAVVCLLHSNDNSSADDPSILFREHRSPNPYPIRRRVFQLVVSCGTQTRRDADATRETETETRPVGVRRDARRETETRPVGVRRGREETVRPTCPSVLSHPRFSEAGATAHRPLTAPGILLFRPLLGIALSTPASSSTSCPLI